MFITYVTELVTDVEEIITASSNQSNVVNSPTLDGLKDNDEECMLQLKQNIASDLVSLLLCVGQVPGSGTAGVKSCSKNCNDILENIISRVSYYWIGSLC
jgi:hypothetical protein